MLKKLVGILIATTIILTVGCSSKSEDKTIGDNTLQTSSSEPEMTPESKDITDMSGRTVTIPYNATKVYGVNNNSTYLLFTLVPDRLIGWNFKLTEDTKKYIPEIYQKYPVVGNMYGNGQLVDVEELLKYSPELIVLTDTTITDKSKTTADELQNKTGVPVIVVEANINNYDKTYQFLGEVFNVTEKAKKLADYYKESYDYAIEKSALIDKKITVYYAREDDGLSTDFKGSSHTEVLDLVGGENVAVATTKSGETGTGKGDGSGTGAGSGSVGTPQSGTVSIEQLLKWNPEVILVGYSGSEETKAMDTIKTNNLWSGIDAVKNSKVYNVPHAPFNWFDRPPSVNRIIGIKWLGNLLYPEIYDCDIKSEVKEFFSLFYGYDLNDTELEELLN